MSDTIGEHLSGSRDHTVSDAAPPGWDSFVAEAPNGAYTQLSAWAEVKRANGWRAVYVLEETTRAIGTQLLVRRLGPLPWQVGYAPRGPVARDFDRGGVVAWTACVRTVAREQALTHVTVDPEVEEGDPLADWLREAGWRPGTPIQPNRSRVLDLAGGEAALWSGLRSKWRQYVQKARRAGVVVVEATERELGDFYRIYVETARRAGFVHRAARAYEDVYRAFAARNAARLLIARLPGGEPVATIMLLACGRRVIEPYGGMTDAGAESRANYLLKWEAIRSSAERGYALYDMWGLAHPGIEQFKAGFGGREIRYIGAWELVTNRPLHAAVGIARRARVAIARRSRGSSGIQEPA
jgi:lipid II:glycine glycyltransferase (peptidoglycan interpeptide bridge formation enzyme)